MSERLRMLLPAVAGGLSIPLIFWDIHNARVIESMGMAWDMGPPVWPYQASDILLRLLNGPAYSIAMPIANVLRLPAPLHFIVVAPFILIWWWFFGSTLDRGIAPWRLLGMVSVLLTLLSWSITAIHSLFLLGLYPISFDRVALLRFLTPVAWLLALTCLMLWRRNRHEASQLA
jgi:hypothetical protein